MKITIKIMGLIMAGSVLTACSTSPSSSIRTVNSPIEAFEDAPTAVKGALYGGTIGNLAGLAIGGSMNAFTLGLLGAVTGSILGAYLDNTGTESQLLGRRNVQVVQHGDYVKIVIPSSQLFVGHSDVLTSGARSTLSEVANYVAPLQKISIHVSAFSTAIKETQENSQTLTASQAASVANYLWEHDVDARLMTTAGYSDAAPSTNKKLQDQAVLSAKHYRVEISFRDLSNS